MSVYGDHERLWVAWRQAGAARAEMQGLVLAYQPLLRTVAASAHRRMPTSDVDELMSHGALGLIDAIERFDPERGVKFEIFAQRRILGAVYEGVRSFDANSRNALRQVKALQQAIERLQHRLGRAPSDRELAGELGVQEATVHRLRVRELELDVADVATVDERSVSAGMATDPSDYLEVSEFRETIAAAFARVTGLERVVLGLYYVDGLRMADIGRLLGVSPSMVSKVHARAVVQVRQAIEDIGSAWAT